MEELDDGVIRLVPLELAYTGGLSNERGHASQRSIRFFAMSGRATDILASRPEARTCNRLGYRTRSSAPSQSGQWVGEPAVSPLIRAALATSRARRRLSSRSAVAESQESP